MLQKIEVGFKKIMKIVVALYIREILITEILRTVQKKQVSI